MSASFTVTSPTGSWWKNPDASAADFTVTFSARSGYFHAPAGGKIMSFWALAGWIDIRSPASSAHKAVSWPAGLYNLNAFSAYLSISWRAAPFIVGSGTAPTTGSAYCTMRTRLEHGLWFTLSYLDNFTISQSIRMKKNKYGEERSKSVANPVSGTLIHSLAFLHLDINIFTSPLQRTVLNGYVCAKL